MEMLAKQIVTLGLCEDSDVLCIDLEGQRNIDEAKNYVQGQIMILAKDGDDVIVIGHSAGGQLATHFLGATGVKLVVTICAPSHNPTHYPWWMWFKTGKYFLKLLSPKAFALDSKSSELLFGRQVPEHMRGKSAGTLVAQLNMGWLKGNPAPKRRTFAEKLQENGRKAKLLCISAKGDVLITERAVQSTAELLGGDHRIVKHPDHYPHLSDYNLQAICREFGHQINIFKG